MVGFEIQGTYVTSGSPLVNAYCTWSDGTYQISPQNMDSWDVSGEVLPMNFVYEQGSADKDSTSTIQLSYDIYGFSSLPSFEVEDLAGNRALVTGLTSDVVGVDLIPPTLGKVSSVKSRNYFEFTYTEEGLNDLSALKNTTRAKGRGVSSEPSSWNDFTNLTSVSGFQTSASNGVCRVGVITSAITNLYNDGAFHRFVVRLERVTDRAGNIFSNTHYADGVYFYMDVDLVRLSSYVSIVDAEMEVQWDF